MNKNGPSVNQFNSWCVELKKLVDRTISADFDLAVHLAKLRNFWLPGAAGDKAMQERLLHEGINQYKADQYLVLASLANAFPSVDKWIAAGGATQLKCLLGKPQSDVTKVIKYAQETGKTLRTAAQAVGVIDVRAYTPRAEVAPTQMNKQEKAKITHAAKLARFIYDNLDCLPELDRDMMALVGTYVPAVLNIKRSKKAA